MKLTGRLILGACLLVIVTLLLDRWWGVRAALLAIPLAALLGLIAGMSVTAPVVQLAESARAIARRQPPRLPRSQIPAIAALIQAVRLLDRDLADQFAALRHDTAEATAIVDAMVEGVIAADARGRIVLANPAARELLGYAPEAPLPPLATLFRIKAAREAVAELLTGQPLDDREVDLDGKVVAISGRPLGENGAVLVLHDITKVRRLEVIRRDFVANVSHELKTPLTSILGYAETLSGPDVDAGTQARFLATILSNTRRMMRLVDDLLDLSRVEGGRWAPRPVPVEIDAAVQDAWDPLAARAAGRQVVLETTVDPDAAALVVDRDALRQVLSNLLDNALRYVPDGGRIVAGARRVDGGIELRVEDNGIGIPSEHLPRIFERFYRVDPSRSRDAGGTGLGLSIVKHLVEAHGGRVTAESVPREGTTIRIWFPDLHPAPVSATA